MLNARLLACAPSASQVATQLIVASDDDRSPTLQVRKFALLLSQLFRLVCVNYLASASICAEAGGVLAALAPRPQVWDLRNSISPAREFAAHSKGVLAMAWSTAEPGLLLTCGKDNRTLCWDTAAGDVLAELPASTNWHVPP